MCPTTRSTRSMTVVRGALTVARLTARPKTATRSTRSSTSRASNQCSVVHSGTTWPSSWCASPAGYSDGDHPQLLDGDPPNVLQRLGALRVLDRLGDQDHRVDEQRRQDVEVLGAPGVESREARQVGRQLRGDQPDLGADGVAQHAQPAVALPADEAPVLAPFGDAADQDLD